MSVVASHKHLAGRLGRTTVLVVGDLMLDCYAWGDVCRISPEAPVPVVKVNRKTFRLGGAGNVAANLSGLGCTPAIIGLIGQDPASRQVQDLLASFNIEDHCIADIGRPTITKTRIMAGNQQVVRLDEEDGRVIGPQTADHIFSLVEKMLSRVNAVILSDYGKGMFDAFDFTQAMIQACKKENIPIFIDPKGRDWKRYTGATCITPNTAELALAAGTPVKVDSDLIPTASDYRRQLAIEWLLVTRGPRGMALFGDDAPPAMIAARSREVFDVSGAGDTVIATLAACVASGLPFVEAASIANTAAGIVVEKLATWAIRLSELEDALTDDTVRKPLSTLWKVADVAEASERLSRWRQAEQRIVFTNGCFDLLHPGHVSLLHQARRLGDRLIVGLNTDPSIKRLKGAQRPILPGKDRAAILSALEDVDMVVFFDEDTPLDLIGQLKPDILVKGADYRVEDVVGKAVVEAYGGQVRLVEILKGHSTTAIARKLSPERNVSNLKNEE